MSNKKQSFKIGQVVYVLSDKAEAIVPAVIVEEMVVKKLDGSSVSWKVAVGPPNKKKIVETDELSGDVYTSLDDIRAEMTKRLMEYVDNLLNEATNRTEQWYGKQIARPEEANKAPDGKIDPASLIDSIEGRSNAAEFIKQPGQQIVPGQSMKITAPVNKGPLRSSGNMPVDPTDPKSVLRARLRDMAEPDPQEIDEHFEGEFVVTEDGRRIPVKYNQNQ